MFFPVSDAASVAGQWLAAGVLTMADLFGIPWQLLAVSVIYTVIYTTANVGHGVLWLCVRLRAAAAGCEWSASSGSAFCRRGGRGCGGTTCRHFSPHSASPPPAAAAAGGAGAPAGDGAAAAAGGAAAAGAEQQQQQQDQEQQQQQQQQVALVLGGGLVLGVAATPAELRAAATAEGAATGDRSRWRWCSAPPPPPSGASATEVGATRAAAGERRRRGRRGGRRARRRGRAQQVAPTLSAATAADIVL